MKRLAGYIDLAFVGKFFLVFLPLYFLPGIYLGVVSPGGSVYFPFLAQYLNFLDWITSSILFTSNFIDRSFGVDSHVNILPTASGLLYQIKVPHGAAVTVWLECLGLGLASFWLAYICAQTAGWKTKLFWCSAGIFTIWFINCWRIAILLLALQNKWQVNKYMEHHALFNCIAYAIMLLLVYVFNKRANIGEMELPAKATPGLAQLINPA